MSTEKSVQPVGPALIPAERERRGSTSWSLRLADSDGHWWSMDQLNGIWKWIRLGGFAQLILLPLLLDLSFSRLLPLPFSLIFLSYPRAIYFVLSSSYTPDNWTDCSVLLIAPLLPNDSSALQERLYFLIYLFIKHTETVASVFQPPQKEYCIHSVCTLLMTGWFWDLTVCF